MHPYFLVLIGGALGSLARYIVSSGVAARFGGFPYGTLAVNLIGGLLMGALTGLLIRGSAGETTRLFVGVGILGGFTTFSAFSLDCWKLIDAGQFGLSFVYMAVSVLGALAALMLGLWFVLVVA
jgi:CrcB protein